MNHGKRRSSPVYGIFPPMGVLSVLLTAGCITTGVTAQNTGSATALQPQSTFVDPATLDPNVPTPESVIGHPVGLRAVRYIDLVRYLNALAEASPLVTLTSYGQSHEGRSLYYLTITSRANHNRLAQIKADNARLADPRTLNSTAQADHLLDQLPGIAWLAYSIHGDELSSTDAAVQIAYQLAAGTDDATRQLREQLVIHIDPLMNPDGRERYMSQIQPLTGRILNTDNQAMQHSGMWSAGRGNHYLFDLNRDWLAMVHPETRGRAQVIRSWNPHLVVDSHEMGSLDTYLFDPPREPINNHIGESVMKWRRHFSADQAKAFDRYGWSYYTKEWYEEWYPGYTNAWTSLLGAVGMLYEQAGVSGAAVKQANGQTLTYGESVHHHVVSSMANLESLRANRREILADFLADRQWAVSDQGPYAETFLLPPPVDQSKFTRFVDLIEQHGLELAVSTTPFDAGQVTDIWGEEAESRAFPAGTLIIRSSQPHRRLLHAILAFDPHTSDAFLEEERKELENRRGTRIYDITAWNVAMAYDLEAYWASSVPQVPTEPLAPTPEPDPASVGDKPSYGWLIDGMDANIHGALVQLFNSECRPRAATKPFKIDGRSYEPGAILLRRHENPDYLSEVLKKIAAELGVDIRPVDTALSQEGPDLGGRKFRLLQPPRVAIAANWPIASTSFGSTWFLLDQRIGLRSSPINIQSLGYRDLRKYNVLILPHTWSSGRLGAVLDQEGVKKIKTWVQAGGTLIALGNATAFVTDKDRDLSSVRRKRDVLDKLAVYEDALGREKGARHIEVHPDIVWGTEPTQQESDTTEPAVADAESEPNKKPKKEIDALKREDQWLRTFRPRGVIAAASLDPEHWLCFGLGRKLPVLISGGSAYMSKPPAATPVRLLDKDHLRLAGLLWPEARQRWENTAYATVERVGNGQIVLFATDPFFRGYFEGTGRLLLNAIVLGPGMGTSTPVPW